QTKAAFVIGSEPRALFIHVPGERGSLIRIAKPNPRSRAGKHRSRYSVLVHPVDVLGRRIALQNPQIEVGRVSGEMVAFLAGQCLDVSRRHEVVMTVDQAGIRRLCAHACNNGCRSECSESSEEISSVHIAYRIVHRLEIFPRWTRSIRSGSRCWTRERTGAE